MNDNKLNSEGKPTDHTFSLKGNVAERDISPIRVVTATLSTDKDVNTSIGEATNE